MEEIKAMLKSLMEMAMKVNNDKKDKEGDDMDEKEKKEVDNEKVDKRKLIDEVGGILKGKVDDEIIKTIIKKMEEASYEDSEKSADNKKVKNEDEDEKEDVKNKKVKNEDEDDRAKAEDLKEDVEKDVKNKCKNSVENSKKDFFAEMNKIYNSAQKAKEESVYESRHDRLKAGEDLFKV